jgi:HSP20 family molecular chaperone IbpA
MSASKQEVTKRGSTDVGSAEAREQPLALIPAVDIYEDAKGITVTADMPGVSKERLNVQADRNNLLIEGEAAIDVPAEMEAIYADVPATRYRRNFALSAELDADGIDAVLKDGVLTVRIPKRAEFQPRRIEIRSN